MKYILAFDTKEEQFREIPLPYDFDYFSEKLTQTCGRLAFIEDMVGKRCGGSSDDKLKLWILERGRQVGLQTNSFSIPFLVCVYTSSCLQL